MGLVVLRWVMVGPSGLLKENKQHRMICCLLQKQCCHCIEGLILCKY